MQKTPLTIALAAAGIVAATAGVAAITTGISPAIEPPAVQQTQVEVQAPAETQAAAETQTQVVVDKPAAPEATAPVVQATEVPPQRMAAASDHEEIMMRIPFTNRMVRVTNPRFPSAGLESPDPQPSTIAYFERLNANRTLVGASGQIFPSAAQELGELQPEAATYLAQLESRRLAAARPAPVAARVDTPVQPMPGTEVTTAQPPQVTAQAKPAN